MHSVRLCIDNVGHQNIPFPYICIKYFQAAPLFKDRRKFHLMADTSLEGRYPMKGLYQALAVTAMCLQEDASKRPVMSQVVSALEYLTSGQNEEQPMGDGDSSSEE